MTNEHVRELAAEHNFKEINCDTEGMISFVKIIAKGRIRLNYSDIPQIAVLSIHKEQKGFKNLLKAFPTHDYNTVYMLFHKPTSFLQK